jgi:hypothetical protein
MLNYYFEVIHSDAGVKQKDFLPKFISFSFRLYNCLFEMFYHVAKCY